MIVMMMMMMMMMMKLGLSYLLLGVRCSIALPPHFNTNIKRSYIEACYIAGLQSTQYQLVDSADALLATYSRKVTALTIREKTFLEVLLNILTD
jgi:hypothetical protein